MLKTLCVSLDTAGCLIVQFMNSTNRVRSVSVRKYGKGDDVVSGRQMVKINPYLA